MKGSHESVQDGDDSDSKDWDLEKGPKPVEEEVDSEEFPTDLDILNVLMGYYRKPEDYRQQIDIHFGAKFGDKVDPAKVVKRTMELELQYLEIAENKSESSLVLPEDKLKFTISKMIWHHKYGHIDQIADIEFLKKLWECSTKKQDYPSGKDDAKRIEKLQKKYLRSLKRENGIAMYSMSPEDEEFFRLSYNIWYLDAAELSGQESKSCGRPEEPLPPTKRTLDDVPDNELLKCVLVFCAKNKAYPQFRQLIQICRNFMHIDVEDVSIVKERLARLRWKYLICSYDQEIFKLSRLVWGDTLGDTYNQDSTEENSSGGEEDDTDNNKNDKKGESPKS